MNLAHVRQKQKRYTRDAGRNSINRGRVWSFFGNDRNDCRDAAEVLECERRQQNPADGTDGGATPFEKRAKPSAGYVHHDLLDGAG